MDTLEDRVDKIEHRRLRPVHVLQHHHQRSLGREHLQQATDRPGGVRTKRLADAQNLGESITDGRAIRLGRQPLTQRRRDDLRLSRRSADSLGEQINEWGERDPLAVGGRLSDEHRRAILNGARECRRQSRLAHAGRRRGR